MYRWLKALPILVLWAGSAAAADLTPPAPEPPAPEVFDSRWSVAGGAYLWAASLDGRVGAGSVGPGDVHASFGDIFKNLDMAFMAAGEVRYDRFGVFADLVYTRVSADGTDPGSGIYLKATNSVVVGTLLGEARVFEQGKTSADVMAGARLWSVSAKLTGTPPGGPSQSVSGDEVWVDPMVGVKGQLQGNSPWYVMGWAMIGGFGVSADLDWDVMGGVGYRVTDHISLLAGYRALGVDYSHGNFTYDVVEHGPVVSAVLRF
ncbi:hypothetical protein [Acuticoccus mangrovi]|uniref:Outer membrane protein beta-barrel domain-containing protein n=1 Tax=Acuticoccus mangrovi TaxID=2796142 RepID=A0A934IQ29_9HYPH|nr:hypothetical protein [Acuticoccus mangrovi]MBJ3775965.1 hypothetical protein [Acuticoccus mangrovi]